MTWSGSSPMAEMGNDREESVFSPSDKCPLWSEDLDSATSPSILSVWHFCQGSQPFRYPVRLSLKWTWCFVSLTLSESPSLCFPVVDQALILCSKELTEQAWDSDHRKPGLWGWPWLASGDLEACAWFPLDSALRTSFLAEFLLYHPVINHGCEDRSLWFILADH